MDDIVPELLEAIQEDFNKTFLNNPAFKRVTALIQNGTATYKDAADFATWTGNALSSSIKHCVTSDVLPDGKMYYNIADRILGTTLQNDYEMITKITDQIQTSMNLKIGISVKAVKPKLNKSRIDGLVNRLAEEPDFDKVSWLLGEPIVNFHQSIVDDAVKANVAFHAELGLEPSVHRVASPGCCEWCNAIAGTYKYPRVPDEIYRRHERCRCTVEYYPEKGTRQNVWTKEWS